MGNTETKKKKKKGDRLMSHHRSSLAIAIFALLVLIIVVGIATASLKKRETNYKAQQIELNNQLEKEKERSAEIDGLEEYMKSDEYVEEVAREKLDLVYPDEIVFQSN